MLSSSSSSSMSSAMAAEASAAVVRETVGRTVSSRGRRSKSIMSSSAVEWETAGWVERNMDGALPLPFDFLVLVEADLAALRDLAEVDEAGRKPSSGWVGAIGVGVVRSRSRRGVGVGWAVAESVLKSS